MDISKIVGILNITDDSFSDGGRYLEAEAALKKAAQLIEDGAAIIDIGAASSNPGTHPVPPQVEIARLEPVIDFLQSKDIPISIDTFNPVVQRYAIKKGVQYLNDIQGFSNSEIYRELADSDCKLIVMHSIQRIGPATMVETKPAQVLAGIVAFFEERLKVLQCAGVPTRRMIIDPGMGFFLGSNPESSILVLKNIQVLREHFDLPLFIGVSRKSFLSAIVGGRTASERGAATLAAEIYLYEMGVDYIRTHDVSALHDAVKIMETLKPV